MPKDSPLVWRWPWRGSNFLGFPSRRTDAACAALHCAGTSPASARTQKRRSRLFARSRRPPPVAALPAPPRVSSGSLCLPPPPPPRVPFSGCPPAPPSAPARPTRGERGARAGGGTTCARRTAPRGAPEGAGPEPRASCARRRPPPGPGSDLARAH